MFETPALLKKVIAKRHNSVSVKTIFLFTSATVLLLGQESRVFESKHAAEEVAADTDPNSQFWHGAPAIIADRDPFGKVVPAHRTEVRSRWTAQNLYFLFICPYEQLNLKPHPRTDAETNQLWNWDVAEVFIGSDFQNIRKYKEFEVSPQREWIDLDIDLNNPHHEDGWMWNSGFKVSARIDTGSRVWYAFMRIPYSSVDVKPAAPGNILRVNFYRAQGPLSRHKAIAWQPTHQATYHVPEAFGSLKLVE
jgi:Carbohydrate family 9 binding domain-like